MARKSSSSSSAVAAAAASGPLSTADLVHRLPPAVLRILVSFAPLIELSHALLVLATWSTPHPHHSLLLVVAYALAVIAGYPLLRYAPQLIVLAYVAYAWLAHLRPAATASRLTGLREVNAAKLNALVAQLDDIADAASTLRRQLITPALALLSWAENPTRTKRLVIFLLSTYPLYLACYFPWAALGLPTLQLDVLLPWRSLASARAHLAARALQGYHLGQGKLAAHTPAALQEQWTRLVSHPQATKAQALYSAHLQPRLAHSAHLVGRASHALALRYVPSKLSFQVLPPFPLGSLSVRSTILFTGILALTWCAPWAALIRSALWRSALVRRIVLGLVRLFSGEKGPLAAFGRGHETTLDPLTGESVFCSSLIRDTGSKDKKGAAQVAEKGVVKHEDVVYEFSVYENQRWWMGLDWTSALLPQERPSWSDEHHNAVSPPSTFSLPPPKVTWTPQEVSAHASRNGASANGPTRYTKRSVHWKWLDPEWTVAGAGYVGSLGYAPPGAAGVPSEAALALARSGDAGGGGGGGGGGADAASSADSTASTTQHESLPGGNLLRSGGAGGGGGAGAADVDPEGWSYGDNLWDKMSGKSGRGRYTRRRRWVRRALLEIKVERDVERGAAAAAAASSS